MIALKSLQIKRSRSEACEVRELQAALPARLGTADVSPLLLASLHGVFLTEIDNVKYLVSQTL